MANVARLTATVALDRIIADQASFPIRMWKGFQIVLVILSYFNKIGREIIWDFVSKNLMHDHHSEQIITEQTSFADF